jgi:arsenite methyltransferase
MDIMEQEEIKAMVRKNYGAAASATNTASSCCGSDDCCGDGSAPIALMSLQLGYSKEELAAVPEGANLGLGCGNPSAIAALKPGEVVLDLGSGAGFDCFLAAPQVGEQGHVIGVDMTPEMVSKARANAAKVGHGNVEFRLGEIEHLPVADSSVDVIISNCVINLVPDKAQALRDAFRVLRNGGRLAISDVVATTELPLKLRNDRSLVSGCVAGAALIDDMEAMLVAAGFENIKIAPMDESRNFIREWVPGRTIEDYLVSATIEAVKPGK